MTHIDWEKRAEEYASYMDDDIELRRYKDIGEAGYLAGVRAGLEEAAKHLDDYRKAYAEDLAPSSEHIEDIDPKLRTRVSFKMGRFVLDNARRHIRELMPDGKP